MFVFQVNTAEEMQQEMITMLQHSIKQRESERNTTNRKGDLKQIDARVCELQTILGVLLSCRIEPKPVGAVLIVRCRFPQATGIRE